MKKNYTHITLVVDRSGSMANMQRDAQGGINHLIQENKKAPGECTFSLYQFDTTHDRVFGPAPISMMGEYNLTPRGGTALLDAQWKAIQETGEFLKGLPEADRPSKVIFVTVTDGEENSSVELRGYSGSLRLKNKVTEQREKYNWDFAYLGANQDAFAVGASMGYTTTTQYAGTGASASATYGSLSDSMIYTRMHGGSMASTLATNVAADGTITPPTTINTNKTSVVNDDDDDDDGTAGVKAKI